MLPTAVANLPRLLKAPALLSDLLFFDFRLPHQLERHFESPKFPCDVVVAQLFELGIVFDRTQLIGVLLEEWVALVEGLVRPVLLLPSLLSLSLFVVSLFTSLTFCTTSAFFRLLSVSRHRSRRMLSAPEDLTSHMTE